MTIVQDQTITEFVARVKKALVGQDANVVADLTDNLEADLLDRQSAEGAAFVLGDPRVFAAELLASAGLSGSARQSGPLGRFTRSVAGAVWRFLKVIRPAWWVFRGLMAYTLIWFVLLHQEKYIPDNAGAWLALMVLIIASVQVGRANSRKWAVRAPLALLNILAILVSGYWLVGFTQVRDNYQRMSALFDSGMLLQHARVVQYAYAYDENGKQLPMSTIRDGSGNIIFEQPSAETLPSVLSGLIGNSLKNAVGVLGFLDYQNVKIDYQTAVDVKPGTVTDVRLSFDAMDVPYVELVVAK